MQHGGAAHEMPSWAQLASQPTEAEELRADNRAAEVLLHPPRPSPPANAGNGNGGDGMPAGAPEPVRAQARRGHPLEAGERAWFGDRFGTDLTHVRVHTDHGAASLAEAAAARAFTVGSHVFFNQGEYRPGTPSGRGLLAHELAHVEQAGTGGPLGHRLWRAPKGKVTLGEPEINPPQASTPATEEWLHVEVFATGMDAAAKILAEENVTFAAAKGRPNMYVGLHPKFIKIYDGTGKSLARIPLKEKGTEGLMFQPGVWVQFPQGLVSLTVSSKDPKKYSFEGPGASVIGSVPFTAKEKAAIAEEEKKAKAEGRDPKPPPKKIFNLEAALADEAKYKSLLTGTPRPLVFYFAPKYDLSAAGKGKGGEGQPSLYASPIEGRGDGKPANAPPWPVSMTGPKLAPIDASPTYEAKVDWTANNNTTLVAQVISQVGETIHYRWELFDVTQYARKELAKDPAATKSAGDAPPEKTLEQRVEEFKTSKAGTGKDVTGMAGAAHREFHREFEDWWKDTKRASKGTKDPKGDTVGERLSNQAANRLALELAPVSLLTTALGAALRWFAELFAGPRKQQEINLDKAGIYLVRVITTPGINEDREGKQIIRPPSVAARVVEVTTMEKAVKESLDEPGAQLAELQAQIDLADAAGEKSKADYLRTLLAEAKQRFEGSPLDLLVKQRNEKVKALAKFKADFPSLSTYSRETEIDKLDDQIALYQRHAGKVARGKGLKRVNATLISEVTAQQYPLLLSAGPMEPEEGGKAHRWMISDVTNRDGDAFVGQGDTPSAAFRSALEKFGGKAAYGRGQIGVRTAGLDLEAGAPAEMMVESAPTDWALAEKRIDDLVMTLAAIGLFVASAGTAGAIIGAGVAAARLIQRWQAGKLYLDAATVSDVLGVLGGVGATLQLAGGLRVAKFEKNFAVVQEGRASEAQIAKAAEALKGAKEVAKGIELANEALNYGGLIWGNVSFLDQMLDINAQEASGAMTHAQARRARAGAISSAVNNNAMFIAGNVLKARAQAKAQAGGDAPPTKGPAVKETAVPKEGGTVPQGGPGDKATVPKEGATPKEGPAVKEPLPSKESAPPKETLPKESGAGQKVPPGKELPKDTAPPKEAAPPKDKAPGSDEGQPKGEHEQAGKAPTKADPVPIGERRATLQEMQAALPPDLRKSVRIDGTLEGDSVHVDYTVDKKTGLITEIVIRCSPDARPATVALHEGTARTMEKYQGFMGRVRQALSFLAETVGFETSDTKKLEALKKENKAWFEAALEVDKLPKAIEKQMARMRDMEPNARDMAEGELENLQNQLDKHLRTLDAQAGTEGQGVGYVAAKGMSKAKQKQYADKLAELRGHAAGTKEHKRIRREMYELAGGDMPYPQWEKIYNSNVERAAKGTAAELAELKRLGWGEHQKTVDVPGSTEKRRFDIAEDKGATRRAVEVKAYETGVVYATEDILGEVNADAKLKRYRKWDITWLFVDCEPSGPLLAELHKAGITVEVRARGQRSRTIPPPAK